MTLLRPTLARHATRYPDSPVTYRRPVLRTVIGTILAMMTGLELWLAVSPDPTDTGRDWWVPLGLLILLGGGYLYLASTMTVDRTHVTISNPLRQARIPLAHVVEVVPGGNLAVKTDYGLFYAWGVEAANAQVFSSDYGSQESLQALITRAAQTARAKGEDDEPDARYRLHRPGTFLCLVGIMLLSAAAMSLWRLAHG